MVTRKNSTGKEVVIGRHVGDKIAVPAIAKIYPEALPYWNEDYKEWWAYQLFSIRKLTEGECPRLMDVPEELIVKMCQSPELSKSAIYKLAGNSIVVSCIRYIIRNIYRGEADPFDIFSVPFRAKVPDTINLVTLCSGYDSQAIALGQVSLELGCKFDLLAWSEFDPESKRPLDKQPAVVAHNLLFPQWADRNVGDMTKVDWDAVKATWGGQKDVDILTYSTPCFVAGTMVLTTEGYKPIEEIKVGDMVLTHTNSFKPVLEVGKKPAHNIIKVRAMMFDEICCTPNHPFYTREMYRYGHKSIRAFREPVWKAASELTKNDYLGFAINTKSELPIWEGVTLHRGTHWDAVNTLSAYLDNKDFWYLMGRYVGDGWQRDDKNHKAILIACADKDKESLTETLNNLGWKYTYTEENTCGRITIYGKELCEFVNRFGKYAYGKHIDAETMNLPVDLLKAFLVGYVASDGCFVNGEYRVTTVSRELAYGLMQIIAKCLHRPSRIYRTKRPDKYMIGEREVNQRDTYVVLWHNENRKQDKAFYEDGYCWYPVKEVAKTNRHEFVYNMEVEEDHSYTANGAIVHNCQSISQAGKREGMKEGSDTRSAILWYTENAIRSLRPKFLLQENVRAIINSTNIDDFKAWQNRVSSLGYTSYYTIMNAKEFGVPQNRERMFMLSVRNDMVGEDGNKLEDYTFPKPFPLTKCIADILDEKVDDCYFLKADSVLKFLQKNEEENEKGVIYDVVDHHLTQEELESYWGV